MEVIVAGRPYGIALYVEGDLEEIHLIAERCGARLSYIKKGPLSCYKTRVGGFSSLQEAMEYCKEQGLPIEM